MYVLIIYDEVTADKEAAPFLTLQNAPVSYVFAGIKVAGTYATQRDASDAGRTLDQNVYSWMVCPIHGEIEYVGPWWCPKCSTAFDTTLQTNMGEPCCPKCGNSLEEQGTGDDATD